MNIAAWTYVDKFSICLVAEERVIPDGMKFMGYLEQGFAEYLALYIQNKKRESDEALEQIEN